MKTRRDQADLAVTPGTLGGLGNHLHARTRGRRILVSAIAAKMRVDDNTGKNATPITPAESQRRGQARASMGPSPRPFEQRYSNQSQKIL